MRINHKPGDTMEVDWAGGTLPITDPVTGSTNPAYLFVAVLPCKPVMPTQNFANRHAV